MPNYPRDLEKGQRIVGNLKPYEWVWIGQPVVKCGDDGKQYLDPKAPFHASSSDSSLDAKWRFQVSKRYPEKLWVLPDSSKPLAYYCLVPPIANNNPIWPAQSVEKDWVPVNFLERLPILDRFNNMSWLKVSFLAAGIVLTIDGVLGNPFKDQLNLLVNVVAGGSPLLARAVVPVATSLLRTQILDAEQTAQEDTGNVIDDDTSVTPDQLQAPSPGVTDNTSAAQRRLPSVRRAPGLGGRVIPLRHREELGDDDEMEAGG